MIYSVFGCMIRRPQIPLNGQLPSGYDKSSLYIIERPHSLCLL